MAELHQVQVEILQKNLFLSGQLTQSCKLLRHLGTSCPVGLETTSRILKIYHAIFAMSKILKVTPPFLDIFGLNFGILERILADFGHFLTDFD